MPIVLLFAKGGLFFILNKKFCLTFGGIKINMNNLSVWVWPISFLSFIIIIILKIFINNSEKRN